MHETGRHDGKIKPSSRGTIVFNLAPYFLYLKAASLSKFRRYTQANSPMFCERKRKQSGSLREKYIWVSTHLGLKTWKLGSIGVT
jgi:hypothetical protein